MSSSPSEFVLPRPGEAPSSQPQTPIAGPSEADFTKAFGTLLPPAKFLNTVNGRAAYYELPPSSSPPPSGSAASTPSRVLLIHGIQTPALGLLPLARALRASHPHAHLVLYDHWGHGLSDTPRLPHEASLFYSLIDSLLDQLDWPTAHLVGYSFGGRLTAGYVSSRPSRVQSFTLIAPAGLFRRSDFSAEEQGYLSVGGGGDEVAVRKWVVRWLEGGELVVPVDWKERVARGDVVAEAIRQWEISEHAGHAASIVAIVRDSGVIDGHEDFRKAAQSGLPSLAILGGLDEVCSEQQLQEQGVVNVAVIPQVGHNLVRELPVEVAALISDFWSKLTEVPTS